MKGLLSSTIQAQNFHVEIRFQGGQVSLFALTKFWTRLLSSSFVDWTKQKPVEKSSFLMHGTATRLHRAQWRARGQRLLWFLSVALAIVTNSVRVRRTCTIPIRSMLGNNLPFLQWKLDFHDAILWKLGALKKKDHCSSCVGKVLHHSAQQPKTFKRICSFSKQNPFAQVMWTGLSG